MERTAAGKKADKADAVEILDEQQQLEVIRRLERRIDNAGQLYNRLAGVLTSLTAFYFVLLYLLDKLPGLRPLNPTISIVVLLPSLFACTFLSFNPAAFPNFITSHLEPGGPALLLALLAATQVTLPLFDKLLWMLPGALVVVGYEARSESLTMQKALGALRAKQYASPNA